MSKKQPRSRPQKEMGPSEELQQMKQEEPPQEIILPEEENTSPEIILPEEEKEKKSYTGITGEIHFYAKILSLGGQALFYGAKGLFYGIVATLMSKLIGEPKQIQIEEEKK